MLLKEDLPSLPHFFGRGSWEGKHRNTHTVMERKRDRERRAEAQSPGEDRGNVRSGETHSEEAGRRKKTHPRWSAVEKMSFLQHHQGD